MASFGVYDTAGVSQGALLPSEALWDNRQHEDGVGSLTVDGDVSTSLLAESTVIRVNDGTADRFAFVPTSKTRREVGQTSEVTLEGPGVRWLLTAGQVYQEDLSDCALPADVRWFGWMASAYDDSSWTAPSSHGFWRDHPFATTRPEGWPTPLAEYIWRTTDTNLDDEDCLFRQDFTLSEDQDVVLCITADDEYECWLDGTKLKIGQYGTDTKYAWTGFDKLPLKLCSGSHTFAVRGRNLDIPAPNPAWVMWAFTDAAGDGEPAADNHISAWSSDAESGTFTIRETSNNHPSITVDVDDSLSTLQGKLDTALGAGNSDVTGAGTASKNDAYDFYTDATGGTFTITVDGQTTSGIAYNASTATITTEVEGLSTVTDVTVTGSGTSGDPWRMEFVGADAETSFTVSFDGSSLSGGTLTDDQVSEGTPYDPWLVEGIGALANTQMVWYVEDESNLVGGTLTVETTQVGNSAAAIAKSDTTTVVHFDPASSEPGMTPGAIMKTAADEVRARGTTVLDDVSDGYSATQDSDGVTWTFEVNLPVNLPADLHRLAVLLEEQGVDVWMTPDLTLEIAEEQGTDKTGTVTLAAGSGSVTDVVALQEESTVQNVIRIRTTKTWATRTDATSVSARGRWESGIVLTGFDTVEAAKPHLDMLLDDLASPPRKTTLTVPSEGAAVPYADFGVGDRINAPAFGASGFVSTAMRVIGLSGRLDESSVVWSVEVVD